MSRQIEFIITVEIEDDQEVGLCELEEVMSEMEELCAKRGYGLYDAQIREDGEYLTDIPNNDRDVDERQEHNDFAQDDGYDGTLGEG